MDRLPKILPIVFVISLIAATGLGFYYFYFTNSSFQKTIFSVRSLPYRIGIADRVVLESAIPGLRVQVTEEGKLKKAIEDSGFWQKAVPAYGSSPSSLVKPTSLKILLISEEQSGFKVAETQKDIEDKKASKSLGFDYDEKAGKITFLMHYSSNYITKKTNEELAQEITKDVVYYLYVIAGKDNITTGSQNLFSLAKDYTREYLSQREFWLKVVKNG